MAGSLRIYGSNSGYIELQAPATAGASVLTLPTDSIQSGLVLVANQSFTSVSSVSFNNCFSSLYDNYRILISGSGTSGIRCRMRISGSDDSSANYYDRYIEAQTTTVATAYNSAQTYTTAIYSFNSGVASIDVFSPNLIDATRFRTVGAYGSTTGSSQFGIYDYYSYINTTSKYDGITFYPASGIFSGTIRIYGYRNS